MYERNYNGDVLKFSEFVADTGASYNGAGDQIARGYRMLEKMQRRGLFREIERIIEIMEFFYETKSNFAWILLHSLPRFFSTASDKQMKSLDTFANALINK